LNINKILFYILFSFISTTTYGQVKDLSHSNKKLIKNSSLSVKEYGMKIIDSLGSIGIDTIIAYSKYIAHEKKRDFEIIYITKKRMYQITLLNTHNKPNDFLEIYQNLYDSTYFKIVFSNRIEIFSLLDNPSIFQDTIFIDKNKMQIVYPGNHGYGYFFYLKIGSSVKSNDYCCGLFLNEDFYQKAFSLWQLASAFNNYFYLEKIAH
jgi:hypothetical protein